MSRTISILANRIEVFINSNQNFLAYWKLEYPHMSHMQYYISSTFQNVISHREVPKREKGRLEYPKVQWTPRTRWMCIEQILFGELACESSLIIIPGEIIYLVHLHVERPGWRTKGERRLSAWGSSEVMNPSYTSVSYRPPTNVDSTTTGSCKRCAVCITFSLLIPLGEPQSTFFAIAPFCHHWSCAAFADCTLCLL